MKAEDVMVRDVVTVGPDSDVTEAIKLFGEHDVSALPVINGDDSLVGLLSEADLLSRGDLGHQHPWWIEALMPASTLAGEFAKAHGKKVSEVMSTDLITAEEDTPVSEIAALLERNRINRVPIVDEDGRLVGIVSRSNLIQALASAKPTFAAKKETDRAIRLKLLDRLGEQKWTDFGSRNITVEDGVVHLWGLVGSESERKALTALAEEIPGVAKVSDEMIPAY